MQSLLARLLTFTIIFAAQTSFAGLKCVDIYTKVDPIKAFEEGILKELDEIKMELGQTNKLSVVNNNIHALVVTANRILDQAADLIIQINFYKFPEVIRKQKADVAQHLIERIQQTFLIPDSIMSQAFNNRIEIEGAEIQAQNLAQQQRRAIGFARNQSSDSFHAEKSESIALGFVKSRPDEAESEGVKESILFGSNPPSKVSAEKSIREIVEYVEPLDFIGFMKPKSESGKSEENLPIGFVQKRVDETITQNKLHQLFFNFETGVFEFVKAVEG